ncbi:hypothetical protein JTB14_031008 [Gonioctena quinquepunctata]|nr:hypothetical protein JTB14_031008 [Gonioctena quinquepunctata]
MSWADNMDVESVISCFLIRNFELERQGRNTMLMDKELIVRQHKIVVIVGNNQNKVVSRLPPYHCELNPMELVWAVIKHSVAAKNTTYKFSDMKQLLEAILL